MNVIKNGLELKKLVELTDAVYKKNTSLPFNVFNNNFSKFTFCDFHIFCHSKFHESLISFLKNNNEKSYFIIPVDPDYRYYLKHFNYSGSIEFTIYDSSEDYIHAITKIPNANIADAIAHSANKIIITSSKNHWAIFLHYYYEIAVCGFYNQETKSNFMHAIGEDYFFDIDEAVLHLQNLYDIGITKDRIKALLYESYSDH